jgi:hypothetical protein
MWYKLEINKTNNQIDIINNGWFNNDFKPYNPTIKEAIYFDYNSALTIKGYAYLPKMWISKKYITEFIEIVEELPTLHNWLDETCKIQAVLTLVESARLMIAFPELCVYCKENGINRYEEFGFAHIYFNYVFNQHYELLKLQYNCEFNVPDGYELVYNESEQKWTAELIN